MRAVAVYFRLVGFRLLHTSMHIATGSVTNTMTTRNSGRVNVTLPPANCESQAHPLTAYTTSAEAPATKVKLAQYSTIRIRRLRGRENTFHHQDVCMRAIVFCLEFSL